MRGSLLRLLLVWTGLGVVGQSDARGYRKPPQPTSSVSFTLYNDYLIVVRGSAGPLKGLNFLIDTGTSPSILDQRLAQRLRLTPTPAVIEAVGGNVQGSMATAPSLQFGPLRRENLPILIRDLSTLQLPIQLDGIVGLDVLGQNTFVIDYASRRISFDPSPSLPASTPSKLPASVPLPASPVYTLILDLCQYSCSALTASSRRFFVHPSRLIIPSQHGIEEDHGQTCAGINAHPLHRSPKTEEYTG